MPGVDHAFYLLTASLPSSFSAGRASRPAGSMMTIPSADLSVLKSMTDCAVFYRASAFAIAWVPACSAGGEGAVNRAHWPKELHRLTSRGGRWRQCPILCCKRHSGKTNAQSG